ncbi:unnamed protein product [Cylicocyclus nassatus]|uniref:G-protein coupled receptors family 1 profile domain-containing protein n=1 Tax=Cylicocyclus nassatus TaxID=53992 RepID=A0AA36HCP1_CYLNA|nr:unnamed protein product [Cylicocyclus nassatus]
MVTDDTQTLKEYMNRSVIQCLWDSNPHQFAAVERFFVGIALLIVAATSFVLNLTLGYLVCRSAIFEGIFRWHVVSLVTSALSYLTSITVILIPTALFGLQIDDPLNTILTIFDVFGYLALTFTTALIALDRFVVFFFNRLYTKPKSNKLLSCVPALPWTLSIILTVHMTAIGCCARTNPFTLTYTYECSVCGLYDPIMYYLNFSLPGITLALYVAIYCKIMYMRSQLRSIGFSSIEKKKVYLVLQCSLICLIQIASSSSFYIIPAVMKGPHSRYYVTMIISTLNSLTNPCVMFAFQPRLRRALRYGHRRNSTKDVELHHGRSTRRLPSVTECSKMFVPPTHFLTQKRPHKTP